MTPQRAFAIAAQWGSFMYTGDPGACFYAFRFNDGRPQDEEHRQACLAYADRCKAVAAERGDSRGVRELEKLKAWLATTPLYPH